MTPARDLAIRPLGLGEIIDRSIALTRRHFRTLFAAMLAVEAPVLALGRLHQARTSELLAMMGDPGRLGAALPSLAGAFAALVAVLLVIQLTATAAVTAIVAPSLDPRSAHRATGAQRVVAVATATLVQVVAVVGAPALGAAPGLLLAARAGSRATQVIGLAGAVVGAIGAFVVALVRLVLVPAVAAVEARGGAAAALRSARLMAPDRGGRFRDRPGLRASLVLLATFLLAVAVNGLAGLPRAVAARAAGVEGPLGLLGATLPLPLEVAVSVFEAAAAAALQPFSLVAVAVLYFERRARAEALDVEIWATRIEAER
jgi:hypothetical protein